MRAIPGRSLLAACAAIAAAALAALLAGASVTLAALGVGLALAALAAAAAGDFVVSRRAWHAAQVRLRRRLPPAFAIGVERPVVLSIERRGAAALTAAIHDHTDPSVFVRGLPRSVSLPASAHLDIVYHVTPTRRGEIAFAPAEVRFRSRLGLCEIFTRVGDSERRRVYPNFAQIARHTWLAADRRLQDAGLKNYRRRGEGTSFNQLSEYRRGDAVRHIDWKATLRLDKPIVREFQDERDQRVMLLIDCGRRMRADDRQGEIGTSHFDQVLNAAMLLGYVALAQGDAVGALTFGTPPGEERLLAPRKGSHAMTAIMGALYGVQPTTRHSDYVAVARDLLRRQGKRALVIVITNFRDEDVTELELALKLMRTRHLVLLASVRERIVGELIEQPLTATTALDVASAHLYEQARRDAFRRLAARDSLMVDAEPERLGVELVNRYRAVKRAGMI